MRADDVHDQLQRVYWRHRHLHPKKNAKVPLVVNVVESTLNKNEFFLNIIVLARGRKPNNKVEETNNTQDEEDNKEEKSTDNEDQTKNNDETKSDTETTENSHDEKDEPANNNADNTNKVWNVFMSNLSEWYYLFRILG